VEIKRNIELEIGLELPDGGFGKVLTMRRVKSSDIIAIKKDVRIRELANEDIDIESKNPVVLTLATASTDQLYAILFSRVVTEFEGVQQITPKTFEDLYKSDMMLLQKHYYDLNGIDVDTDSAKALLAKRGSKGTDPLDSAK